MIKASAAARGLSTGERMNTSEINAALRARFCAPEWALLFNVGDATGTRQSRWADAVAMNLYPSRGLELHGFEVKASRSDWLRELKQPEKSAPVQRFCDRWWIVAPPGVVADGELPPTWGLYEAKGGRITQAVAAPKLEAQPITREFVAAMLRRSSEADEGLVKAAVEAEVARLRERDRQHVKSEIESRTHRATELEKQVEEIERISGVKITRWGDSEQIGRAVKMVLDAGVLNTYGGIVGVRRNAERILKECDEALAAFPAPADREDAA